MGTHAHAMSSPVWLRQLSRSTGSEDFFLTHIFVLRFGGHFQLCFQLSFSTPAANGCLLSLWTRGWLYKPVLASSPVCKPQAPDEPAGGGWCVRGIVQTA